MEFKIEKAFEIVQNTPKVLKVLLNNVSVDWIENNEGENTWSPYEVVGHLIHCEKSHWISRIRIVMAGDEDAVFKYFDGSGQFSNSRGKSISILIDEFTELRNKNLKELRSYKINNKLLLTKATHPALGKVSLKQLLSVWVVHDLNHTKQITRVMAKQYQEEMGLLKIYIRVE